jgi:hypothetical protein
MVLQDLYETEYGIWDHLSGSKSRPLASVAFHPSEDVNTGSLLEETIDNYMHKKIGEHYRLSLVEFLELPVDIVAMMVRAADKMNEKAAGVMSDVEKTMAKFKG